MAFNEKKILDEERTRKKGKTCLREVLYPSKGLQVDRCMRRYSEPRNSKGMADRETMRV